MKINKPIYQKIQNQLLEILERWFGDIQFWERETILDKNGCLDIIDLIINLEEDFEIKFSYEDSMKIEKFNKNIINFHHFLTQLITKYKS